MKNLFIRSLLILILVLSFLNQAFTQKSTLKYNMSISLEDPNNNSVFVSSLLTDIAGNIYVGGIFMHAKVTLAGITLNNHNPDIESWDFFLLKFDPEGHIIWANNGTKSVYGELRKMCVDNAGNLYLTGIFKQITPLIQKIMVIKFDQDGNQSFIVCPSTNTIEPYAIAHNLHHETYIYGYFGGDSLKLGNMAIKNPGSKSLANIFIVKYDNADKVEWVKTFPSNYTQNNSYRDYVSYLLVDDSSNTYITDGFNNDTMRFDTFIFDHKNASPRFLCKINPDGNVIWAKSYGYSNVHGINLSIDNKDNVYVTGNYCDSSISMDAVVLKKEISYENQIYIFKINPEGKVLWGKSTNSNKFMAVNVVNLDHKNQLFLSGNYQGDSVLFGGEKTELDSLQSYFLTSLNENGNPGHFYFTKVSMSNLCTDESNNFYSISLFRYDTLTGQSTFGLTLNKFSFVLLSNPDMTENSFSVFPNPSSNGMFIVKPDNYNKSSEFRIFDSYGRTVKSAKIYSSSQPLSIDLKNFPNGIYILKVFGENRNAYTTKLVISK